MALVHPAPPGLSAGWLRSRRLVLYHCISCQRSKSWSLGRVLHVLVVVALAVWVLLIYFTQAAKLTIDRKWKYYHWITFWVHPLYKFSNYRQPLKKHATHSAHVLQPRLQHAPLPRSDTSTEGFNIFIDSQFAINVLVTLKTLQKQLLENTLPSRLKKYMSDFQNSLFDNPSP